MPYRCPHCKCEVFEKRGLRRVYISMEVRENGLADGVLEEGDVWETDEFPDKDEIIYCGNCEAEWHEEELFVTR